jgi:hypothetical protein
LELIDPPSQFSILGKGDGFIIHQSYGFLPGSGITTIVQTTDIPVEVGLCAQIIYDPGGTAVFFLQPLPAGGAVLGTEGLNDKKK